MAITRFISLLVVCLLAINIVQARKSRLPVKCHQDECQLKVAHFALYSNLKQAIESDFDIQGKEIVALVRSVEVLRKRFDNDLSNLNGTKLIKTLLADEKLVEATKVFNSDEGRALINLYASSVNGHGKNLACSQWRIDEIELASTKLKNNVLFASIFSKIHRNFVKRSGKKCLKHACNSVDENMSQIDSVLSKSARRSSSSSGSQVTRDQLMDQLNKVDDDNGTVEAPEPPMDDFEREFAQEELELCRFFGRTNETNCQTSGRLLSQIRLNSTNFDDYFNDYKLSKTDDVSSAGILANCQAIQPLLTLNLAGLRWYAKNDIIEERKLSSRTFWCPSLSYWLEMDRLCTDLNQILANQVPANTNQIGNNITFAY